MPGRIQSIERAAAILQLLSGRCRKFGVVEIAAELGLPKGTVHGLLRTLQHVGLIEQDAQTGKYFLGAALLPMGSSYLDGNELRTRSLIWSESLASLTRESVWIGALHAGRVLILHHVFRPDDTLQPRDIGALLPAHATALGKVLLAEQADVTRELIEAGLEAYTEATITDGNDLVRELGRTRERGWAVEAGEAGARRGSIASPITDGTGHTVGAIGIFGPPERLFTSRQARPELVGHVREHARAVSRELGTPAR